MYNIFSSAPSPYNEKYPNLEASWGMERRTFGSVYDILASSISPPRQKISKFAEISGYGKGQLLDQPMMFWHLHYHSHGKKYPNLLKSWSIKKGQILAQYTMFLRLDHHPMVKNIQTC